MHEMIYTSAPSTLEAPGLGVVAITSGMPSVVERIMRRLSRFDFFALPDDERSPPQFGIYSHVMVSDSGNNWHICTRTLSTGFDYTNRPNFIAHHLAFTDTELPVGQSVFDVLEASDLFVDHWDSEPTNLEPRPLTLKARKRKANGWQALAIGPDGRQLLVQSHAAHEKVFLIDDSPLQILSLFQDAALNLGAEHTNNISFTTALGADVQGVTFDWIGLIRGTKFAATVQAEVPEKVIDTQRRLEQVTLAKPAKTRKAIPIPAPEVGDLPQSSDDDYLVMAQRSVATRLPPSSPPLVSIPEDPLPTSPPLPPPQSSDKLPIVVCVATGALFLIAVALAVYVAFQWKASLNALTASQAALEVATKSAGQTAEELKQANAKLKTLQSENGSLGAKWQEKYDEAVRTGRDNALGKENAEREAREAREALKKYLDGSKKISPEPQGAGPSSRSNTEPPSNENIPAAAVTTAALDRVACVDPDMLLKTGSVQFNLEVPVESIKAATVLKLEGSPLDVPVTQQSLALQVGSKALDVIFDPVPQDAPATESPAAQPTLERATRLPMGAPAKMTLALRDAKSEESLTALPIGTSIKLELITPTSAPGSTVVYVVLHSLAAPIAYSEPTDEANVQTLDQLNGLWMKFMSNQTCGRLVGNDQTTPAVIEGLQWAPQRLYLPDVWPHKSKSLDQFDGSRGLSPATCRKDGYDIGIVQPIGMFPVQLRLVMGKPEPSFACSFTNVPNRKVSHQSLDKSVKLVGKVERRATDKTTYPLIFFGIETDFRGIKFLKSSSSTAQSEAISGGTNEPR